MFRIVCLVMILTACGGVHTRKAGAQDPLVAAARPDLYLKHLEGHRVGLLVNHTALVGDEHLLDFLLERGVQVVKIFSPEHGFRGQADAGEIVSDSVDSATGIPVISLYGDRRKPDLSFMEGLDIVIYDIQDVGARFYTYISTLHYMMEACAESGKELMVFDRPNPNGHYVDGPILEPEFQSFVGMHPIPVVHGLTVGELARMINGEKWLEGGLQCNLRVIPVGNYDRKTPYSLPVRPSPNLPDDRSVNLYPSICFFEGTAFSLGRGTQFPFQMVGYPDPEMGDFSFTPVSITGMAKNPPHQDKTCYGIDLRNGDPLDRIDLSALIEMYSRWNREGFFNSFFNKLAGTDLLTQQIIDGLSEEVIRAGWREGVQAFRAMRKPYLLYPDLDDGF